MDWERQPSNKDISQYSPLVVKDSEVCKKHGKDCPRLNTFRQGSYGIPKEEELERLKKLDSYKIPKENQFSRSLFLVNPQRPRPVRYGFSPPHGLDFPALLCVV